MKINSEVIKYYWQDFSEQRMWAMPVFILSIVMFINIASDNPAGKIEATMLFFYFVIVMMWGGYRAANAVVEEIQGNTWDNQRLSPVSPWKITLGKLFGSTLYNWYGGIIILLIYLVAVVEHYSLAQVLYNISVFTGVGVLCHAIALLASMQGLESNRNHKKFHTILYLIIALLVSSIYYPVSPSSLNGDSLGFSSQNMEWFGWNFNGKLFLLATLVILLFWTVIAVYRLMRKELQYRNISWVWGLFVVFLMVFVAGFTLLPAANGSNNYIQEFSKHISSINLGVSYAIGVASIYIMYFMEKMSLTRYRMLLVQIRNKNCIKIGELLPSWVISFVLTVIVGVLVCVLDGELFNGGIQSKIVFIVSGLLFILRDGCILHYFLFAPSNKRAGLATIFYLGVLYLLIPALFSATKSFDIVKLFLPIVDNGANIFDIVPAVIHFCVAAALLYRRWKSLNKAIV